MDPDALLRANADDFAALVAAQTEETHNLEFKRKSSPSQSELQRDDKKLRGEVISGFANATGGTMILVSPKVRSETPQECIKTEETPVCIVKDQVPRVIATPFGAIKISQIPDGRFAIRNEDNEELINLVRTSCKGRATWNPRFRNWLASAEALPGILAAVQQDEHS
jgi:hypothetical protein